MNKADRYCLALLTLVLVAAGVCGSLSAAEAKGKRPNVLFLFTDDQRADTISALGNPHIKTPNIDRLVKSGFTFNNAYCMGSTKGAVCLPSRTMLHSGMSLFRLKNVNRGPNFGKSMTAAGYETFHISKRGNTPHALHKSFDHSSYLRDRNERAGGYATAANTFIEFFKSRKKKETPFFAYLGFSGPHDPRGTNAEYRKLYDARKTSCRTTTSRSIRSITVRCLSAMNGWPPGRAAKVKSASTCTTTTR